MPLLHVVAIRAHVPEGPSCDGEIREVGVDRGALAAAGKHHNTVPMLRAIVERANVSDGNTQRGITEAAGEIVWSHLLPSANVEVPCP